MYLHFMLAYNIITIYKLLIKLCCYLILDNIYANSTFQLEIFPIFILPCVCLWYAYVCVCTFLFVLLKFCVYSIITAFLPSFPSSKSSYLNSYSLNSCSFLLLLLYGYMYFNLHIHLCIYIFSPHNVT